MTTQNLVIPGKDNRVVMTFAGVDLTLFTDITVNFGTETFTKVGNPGVVIVSSATQLDLKLGATTQTGRFYATVTGVDVSNPLGVDITSRVLNNLNQITIATGTQLVIEDGSIVANANSFSTDAEMIAYADIRGLTVPATQPEREALLIRAIDYIKSKETSLAGDRVKKAQTLPYPRDGVCIFGETVLNTEIPEQLKNAQIEAAIAANTQSLLTNEANQNVKRERLEGLEVEYFSNWTVARLDRVDAQLRPLMRSTGGFGRTTRIL